MIAQAFANIATQFSAAGLGPFQASKVISRGEPLIDAGGSITSPGEPSERDCMAQVDTVTEAMRQQDGYTEKDVRIIVLAATLAGELTTDNEIQVLAGPYAGSWSLQSTERDPMGAQWDCRGRRA